MKRKFIIAVLVAIATLGCVDAYSQRQGATVEVTSFNAISRNYNEAAYNGVNIKGGYQLPFLGRFYVEPQAGAFVKFHDGPPPSPGLPHNYFKDPGRQTIGGFVLGVNGGVNLFPHVSFVTGPDLLFNCWRNKEYTADACTEAWWRFGLDISVWRLRLRGTFSLALNNPYYNDHNNMYTIGLGYCF